MNVFVDAPLHMSTSTTNIIVVVVVVVVVHLAHSKRDTHHNRNKWIKTKLLTNSLGTKTSSPIFKQRSQTDRKNVWVDRIGAAINPRHHYHHLSACHVCACGGGGSSPRTRIAKENMHRPTPPPYHNTTTTSTRTYTYI